jgi:ammonia channel protein AmtB
VDPVVVQRIWERALAVGLYAGRLHAAPRLHRDQMLRVQEEFAAAGFHAMGGLVGRSRRLVAPEQQAHPADGEDARGHGAV